MINQKKPVDGKTGKDSRAGIHAAPASEPEVDIWDGNTHLGKAVVRNGMWSHTVTNFGEGTRRIKATTGSVASSVWVVEVSTLAIDTTPMVLDGYAVTTSLVLSGRDVLNNAKVRVPTGGVPPYDYGTSDPNVAMVTPQGKVIGMGNGPATITASDDLGRSVSYSVTVRNVYRLIESRGPYNYTRAIQWITSNTGAIIPHEALMEIFLLAINTKYVPGGWARGYPHWYGPTGDSLQPYGLVHTTGYALERSGYVDHPGIEGAVCFVLT